MVAVNAAFADDWVRHAVLLEQFKNGEIKRLMAFLNKEVMPSIIAKADKIATRYQKMGYSKLAIARRRKALLKQLSGMNAVVQGGTKLISARLTGTMSTLAKSEAKWAAQALQRRLPLRVNYTMPSPQLLKSIITTKPMTGRFLKDWAKGVGATTAKNVNQAIMVGVAQGEGVETIVRRIRGTAANGFKDGVLQATRNEAAMVTRTAINHVGQHAREAVFAENKNVVERVQWLAVLDSRTSQICASLDSQTYEVNKGPRPPAHPNCRSVMIPVVKPPQGIPGIDSSKLPMGERAAMGGPVPGNMSFGPWLKRQSAAVQNQILGNAGRGRLFRRGKVPIEKFSDLKTLRPISLARLEALESKALSGVSQSAAPVTVTLPQGPFDILQQLKAMEQGGSSGWSTQSIRNAIEKATGKAPSQQYLPRMLRKLWQEGLIENPVKGSWKLTETGRSGLVKVGGGGKKAIIKPLPPKPAVITPPKPAGPAHPMSSATGEKLRRRLLLDFEVNYKRIDAVSDEAALLHAEARSVERAQTKIRHQWLADNRGKGRGDWWDTGVHESPEWTKLNNTWKSRHAKIAELRKEKITRQELLAKALRSEIAAGGDLKISYHYVEPKTKYSFGKGYTGSTHKPGSQLRENVDEAVSFLQGLHRGNSAGVNLLGEEFTGRFFNIQIPVTPAKDTLRAFHVANRGIYVTKTAEATRTVVHEMAHAIEHQIHGKAARMYRAFRSAERDGFGSLKLPKMQNVTPGEPSEVGWADQWMSKYTGKYYSSGSTEVISMLTEELYADAYGLMLKDPRAFDFIIDTMRGVPVEKQAWFVELSAADKHFLNNLNYSGLPK